MRRNAWKRSKPITPVTNSVMAKLIQDEFTSMRISRQRRYQLRREKEGLCRICGEKAARNARYCKTHLEKQRMLCRKVKTDAPTSNPQDLI